MCRYDLLKRMIVIAAAVLLFDAAPRPAPTTQALGAGMEDPQNGSDPHRTPPHSVAQISGTVSHLKDFKLSVLDQADRFAKLRTEEGRLIPVDLGPVEQVRAIGVAEGDRLVLYGHEGTVNGKPTFMTLGIRAGQDEQMIRRDFDRRLKRLDARVLATRRVDFERNHAPDQLLANVMLENGITTIIHLGWAGQLPTDLQLEGKQIRMLARPAYIGGKLALVAEAIHVDGITCSIDFVQPGGSGGRQRGGEDRRPQDEP